MGLHRRQLLQYTGAGCVLSVLQPALPVAAAVLRVVDVRDAVALPRFAPGDVLLADTRFTRFAGDGLYLYPSWGQPRPYLVQACGNLLEFRNAGSGKLLWTQTAGLDADFAGRVLETPRTGAFLADYPALNVPPLPVPA